MDAFLYGLVALILAGLAAWLARLLARRPSLPLLAVLVVALGLVYDNGIIALGATIGEGPTLERLNWARYWIHALCTPLLILYAAAAPARAGLGGRAVLAGAWILTLAMIVYGVALDLPAALVAERGGGTLSYAPAGGSPAPVPAMVANLALVAGGVALWRRGWRWLALASAAALVLFGLAGAAGLPDLVGQVAEVVLVGGLAATEAWLQRREAGPAPAGAAVYRSGA